jgi:hypothetical protein
MAIRGGARGTSDVVALALAVVLAAIDLPLVEIVLAGVLAAAIVLALVVSFGR